MKASLDVAGRIAIPPDILEAAGLAPGTEFEVHLRDGIIELVPAVLPVRLQQRKYLLVAVPESPTIPLTADEVERTREALLAERSGE
jgi:AbrB family looped-hinge helix DNA binding protein